MNGRFLSRNVILNKLADRLARFRISGLSGLIDGLKRRFLVVKKALLIYESLVATIANCLRQPALEKPRHPEERNVMK